MDASTIQRIALFMPALFLALTVHEYAHARVATWLGDDTPAQEGRLSLSPLVHLDPFGSVLFPLLLLLMPGMGGVFGWARPVRFVPARFRRGVSMRAGAALTAAAGPLSNLLQALLALLLLRLLLTLGGEQLPARALRTASDFLTAYYQLNVLLAAFNLFPLPPLDGHYLLPRSLDGLVDVLRRHAFLLFVAIFFLPVLPGGRTLGGLVLHPMMSFFDAILQAVAFAGA